MVLSINAGRLQGDGIPRQVETVGEAQLEGGFGHILHRYRVGRIKAGIFPSDAADAPLDPECLITLRTAMNFMEMGFLVWTEFS